MVYNFFDKKSTAGPNSLERSSLERNSLERMGSGIARSSVLADGLHKPAIKKI